MGLFLRRGRNDRLIAHRASPPAYHHRQRRQTDLPQHPEGLPGPSVPKGVRTSANGQKVIYRHGGRMPWMLRSRYVKRMSAKRLYAMRKQTIEACLLPMRKEKHAMRYTHHRGLARVTHGSRLSLPYEPQRFRLLWHPRHTHPFFLFPLLSLFY